MSDYSPSPKVSVNISTFWVTLALVYLVFIQGATCGAIKDVIDAIDRNTSAVTSAATRCAR